MNCDRRSSTNRTKDQRRASAWLFGAICPAEGKGAGIVMPKCNSEAMNMHLEEIAFHIAPGAHAVLLLDQAGWHGSAELVVPANITLMPLPPRCPEFNPVENVWQFMRDNWLSNRIFRLQSEQAASRRSHAHVRARPCPSCEPGAARRRAGRSPVSRKSMKSGVEPYLPRRRVVMLDQHSRII